MSTIPKTYDPHRIEERWNKEWLDCGLFHSDPDEGPDPYCIVIPPPNVTGILHMGHALNNTIQDVLIRGARMNGRNACWIPGTDHASIATEGKIVQALREEGISKKDLSRDEFMTRAWEWREKYGGIIIGQLKRLGCACDWERERFTMDDGYARAVLEAFVRLYEKGLIYRGNRLVNWCPVSRSAISDEEVMHRDVSGKLWHFRYPVCGTDDALVVATTRPETMLGDTAVAVHPADVRYSKYVGKTVQLPLVEREIPVIADAFVDPKFGTGCVKVTPAHDPNDFEMGTRHGLAFINIMNEDASMNDNVPEAYRGLTREEARKRVAQDLADQGFMEKIEDYAHSVGYSQRGEVPIEYTMSDQWFMRMDELAAPALNAVETGELRFYPEHWAKTYTHWLGNIRDWCISRQLWWGQRIPVWYRKDSDRNDAANRHVSVHGPDDPQNWEQEEDVLDTWASSWLWPMAVHTWPEESAALSRYYPTAVLVTGFDIIFFWVARMVMAGYEFMGTSPFQDVYIHGIVRDEGGKKMSKSLGNSIDPLTIVDQYSADALRFSLIMLTAAGQDLVLSQDKFEVGRNFGTKIWNAARYMQMQTGDFRPDVENPQLDAALLRPDDIHILARLDGAVKGYQENLARYRLNDVALGLYDFVWHGFCDWYIESSKDILYGDEAAQRESVLTIMHVVMFGALRLLHPIIPFLTEELAHMLGYIDNGEYLLNTRMPVESDDARREALGIRAEGVEYVDAKHAAIRAGRMLMADYGLAPSDEVRFILKPESDQAGIRTEADRASIVSLLKVGDVDIDAGFAPGKAIPVAVTPLGALYMPLEGLIDVEAEKKRLGGQLAKTDSNLEAVAKKLGNENFTSRAPEAVVQQQQRLRDDLKKNAARLAKLIEALGA